MKKFKTYSLTPSTDNKVIGNWPQLKLKDEAHKEHGDYSKIDEESFLDPSPDLSNFIFNNGAKKTDVLSSEFLDLSKGLFVSDNFYSLLKSSSYQHLSYYPIASLNDKDASEYYFLHLLYNFSSYVNIDKSEFFHLVKKTSIQLSDNEARLPPMGRVKTLVLKKDPKIFRLPSLTEIFVSEQFKNTLIENKITGLEFEEFDYYDIFFDEEA